MLKAEWNHVTELGIQETFAITSVKRQAVLFAPSDAMTYSVRKLINKLLTKSLKGHHKLEFT